MEPNKQITFFSHPATEINRSYKVGDVSSFSQAELALGKLVGFRASSVKRDETDVAAMPWAELEFENGTIEMVGVPFMVREIKAV